MCTEKREPGYMFWLKSQVAKKYWQIKHNANGGECDYWNPHQGFVSCKGWHDRLCPMDKMIRPGKMRCMYCWRQLRNTKKARRAAEKAVADVWNKFETPTINEQPQIVPRWSEDEDEEAKWEVVLPDDEPKADASDPLAAHKLATMLGARGECGFESLGESRTQSPVVPEGQQHHHHNILYETVSRLAYIADCNVITRQEVKAASRCGGLPVRPPYLLPRVGMPHVADTEESVYLSFVLKLGDMTLQEFMPTDEEKTRAMDFFGTSDMEKVICCKAALAAA